MNPLTEVSILNKTQISDNVFTIEFKRSFNFKPGQIIGITNSTQLPPRLYSICSSSSSKNISILFNVKNDGELTPPLAQINVGDKIWITEVQGKFTYNNEPAWWIATGTGIAPFYSMFKSGQKPLKLIQGGRLKTDMHFNSTFKELNNYIRCCSQDTGADIYEGRLTRYLEEFNELPTNINYYLCGSAEMVVDVRNLLIGKGIPFGNIITEIYF
jgi:ferredoxin--NADP+ reductase